MSRKNAIRAFLAQSGYHVFVHDGPWLGIPNREEVVSQVPFELFAIWGLRFLRRLTPLGVAKPLVEARERSFVGVFVGSS